MKGDGGGLGRGRNVSAMYSERPSANPLGPLELGQPLEAVPSYRKRPRPPQSVTSGRCPQKEACLGRGRLSSAQAIFKEGPQHLGEQVFRSHSRV